MNKIEIQQAVITFINFGILFLIPCMGLWHFVRIKKFSYWSFDWWQQIIIVLTYMAAINCEIPATWVRILSYYVINLKFPDEIYTLSMWDRWGRALFYMLYFLQTWVTTKKKIPEYVKSVLG